MKNGKLTLFSNHTIPTRNGVTPSSLWNGSPGQGLCWVEFHVCGSSFPQPPENSAGCGSASRKGRPTPGINIYAFQGWTTGCSRMEGTLQLISLWISSTWGLWWWCTLLTLGHPEAVISRLAQEVKVRAFEPVYNLHFCHDNQFVHVPIIMPVPGWQWQWLANINWDILFTLFNISVVDTSGTR